MAIKGSGEQVVNILNLRPCARSCCSGISRHREPPLCESHIEDSAMHAGQMPQQAGCLPLESMSGIPVMPLELLPIFMCAAISPVRPGLVTESGTFAPRRRTRAPSQVRLNLIHEVIGLTSQRKMRICLGIPSGLWYKGPVVKMQQGGTACIASC